MAEKQLGAAPSNDTDIATKAYVDGAIIGGSGSNSDSTFTIQNATDNTKKIQFSASAVTTGTTRILTAPDANGTIVTTSSTQTLTNKTLTKRVVTVASSATPSLNTDDADVAEILSLTVDITNMSTNLSGTPVNEQALMFKIKSASSQTISWGSSFMASGIVSPPGATVAGKIHRIFFIYDNTSGVQKWVCMAADVEGY